jgi:hypothetical protein
MSALVRSLQDDSLEDRGAVATLHQTCIREEEYQERDQVPCKSEFDRRALLQGEKRPIVQSHA